MKIPTRYILLIFLVNIFISFYNTLNAQSTIIAGEVNGIWTKQNSPYVIKGDINIPNGKTLIIQPGVKVIFQGKYKLNVQGKLLAQGTKTDSIIFTYDTSQLSIDNFKGWLGIRFDRRPVAFDTLKFRMPNNENLKKLVQERIENRTIDTSTKMKLVLTGEDIVNDTILPDSIFYKIPLSTLEYCKIEYVNTSGAQRPYIFGGGVYIYRYSNLVINNCTFQNNTAYAGGAIYCKEASPIIANNVIKNCKTASSGGAMVFIHSGVFLYNNFISNNISGYNGGAILFYESSPYVLNNTFIKNKAEKSGGAIYFEKDFKNFLKNSNYKPDISNKYKRDSIIEKRLINRNLLGKNNTIYGKFINNIICNNFSEEGGGITLAATAPEIINNTISNNKVMNNGGGVYCIYASPKIINSIIYGNVGKNQLYLFGESEPEINYCVIENNINGIGVDTTCKSFPFIKEIIAEDPLFANVSLNDYSLTEQSKCIDAGFLENSDQFPLIDIKGKNRIYNNKIDIGAIEYEPIGKNKKKSTDDENNILKNAFKETFVNIYPNPNKGRFYLVIHNNTHEKVKVSIFSSNGSCVYLNEFITSDWFEKEIDLSTYSSGNYLIVVYAGEEKLYNGEIIIK